MADEKETQAPGITTDENGTVTHSLELRGVSGKVPCSETCCQNLARLEVNGFPLCEECLATKLGPTKIRIGTSARISDKIRPCS